MDKKKGIFGNGLGWFGKDNNQRQQTEKRELEYISPNANGSLPIQSVFIIVT